MADWISSVFMWVFGAFAVLWIVMLVGAFVAGVVCWALLRYFRLRQHWRAAGVLKRMLGVRTSKPAIAVSLLLRRWSRGPQYWPSRLAYCLLGATTTEHREAAEANMAALDTMITAVRVSEGEKPLGARSEFAAAWAALFPRWKACVLAFIGLTALTVVVPLPLAWGLFTVAGAVVCWRGYRDFTIPPWGDAIRLGLIGAFAGTLLWSVFAVPLQRNGLVRLSRDIYIPSPEWFLCCIWDGQPPKDSTRAAAQ